MQWNRFYNGIFSAIKLDDYNVVLIVVLGSWDLRKG